MSEEKTFKERYLAGEVEFEDIDDYVMRWGYSDTTRTLREYLGLTVDEETAWVEVSDEALEEMLKEAREGANSGRPQED